MGSFTYWVGKGAKEDATPIEQRYEFVSAAKIDANPHVTSVICGEAVENCMKS